MQVQSHAYCGLNFMLMRVWDAWHVLGSYLVHLNPISCYMQGLGILVAAIVSMVTVRCFKNTIINNGKPP